MLLAGDEVVELNGELLSGLGDDVLQEIVRSAELGGGEVELVIRLQSVFLWLFILIAVIVIIIIINRHCTA